MTDELPISYNDRASGGRGPWNEAPEVKPRAPKAKAEASSPELEQARAEAAAWRETAEQAAQVIADAREGGLDFVGYSDEHDYSDAETIIGYADALLAASESDPYRLSTFVSQWAEQDPATASAWVADRERQAQQAAVQQFRADTHAEYEQAMSQKASELEAWRQAHDDPAGNFLAESAAQNNLAPAELDMLYAGLADADRASQIAEHERSVKESFRDPSTMGMRALDPKTGERRPSLPEPEVADTARYMRGTPEQRAAQREAQVESFRDAFKETSRSPFAEAMAETRAIGEEERADEYEQRAEALRKARLSE